MEKVNRFNYIGSKFQLLDWITNFIKEKDVNSLANHQKNIQSVLSKQVLNHFITINKKILKDYV